MDAIVVVNAGSSSLKFSLFAAADGELALTARGQAEGLYTSPRFVAKDAAGQVLNERSWGEGTKLGHDGALEHLVSVLRERFSEHRLVAVGHRVVHGGLEYAEPTRVDATVLAALEKYVPLAPLHQPHNLAPIRAMLARAPELPQIACFDTAFHRRPAGSRAGVRAAEVDHRARRAPLRLPRPLLRVHRRTRCRSTTRAPPRARSWCCTSATARACARSRTARASRARWASRRPTGCRWARAAAASIRASMLYLMDELRMDARAIEKLIYQQSGLLGVSGISSDMRTLEASADPAAKAAIDLFVYRIGRELGSLAAALGGLDAIVFTAGIGENSARLRERVCADAAWLGVELDRAANAGGGPRISTAASRVAAWVIPTNEELMIARHTRRVLGAR